MIIKLQNGNILNLSKEESDYLNWKKLSPKQKQQSRINKAKAYLNSGPNITNFWNAFQSYIGNKDPKNPHLNTGIVNAPGRATPLLVLLSAKLMGTINNYWKNLGRLKVRLSGGRATSGILTKPGTAPTTFNGLNINYITSPKGGNVTHKFYTDLGSEYILTKDGFARRVKSPHNNTLGQGSGPTEWNAANSDAGLHNWNEGTTIFTEGEDGKLFNTAFYKLSDFGFKPGTYGLARKGEKARIMLIDPKTKLWRAAMLSDVYPTTVKLGLQADRVMETNYSDVPKLGWHILEKANGGWHPGSSVAFIEGLKQGGIIKSANARKWKHKNGGKAFVEGINVLDSNPKAYKYVKKKYRMHLLGGNLVINYIKAIENPNRVGWNGKVWQAPNLKGYDINLRGYGIDINTNQSAKNLTNGRPGRWITDAEATKLMNDHISYITNAANKHIKGFNKLSPQRQAALLGMLYRGDSVNKSGINYLVDDDKKFFTSIGNYYRSKGLNERADNSDKFFKRYLQQGGSIDWNSIANVGVNLLLKVVKNKQISKEAEAAKAMNKLTNRDFFNIYNLKLQEAKQLEEQLAKAVEAMTGTTINSSNIVAANNAWKNASGEYAALKNNVDQQNRAIDAQAQALKSDIWGNAISGVMLLGMGMLNNYLNSKSSKTPNISFNKKTDFGNIKTDVGLLGTYSVNSGYLPKQLSFDWSKVGNIK